MKISEMITKLQKAKEKFGDVEVIMSQDSEGNAYSTISEDFNNSRVYEHEADLVNAWNAGAITGNPKERLDEFFKSAKVVGICLWPYHEYFKSAEEAVNYNKEAK